MEKKGAPKGPFIKFLALDLVVIFGALALAFLIRFQEFRIENTHIYYRLIIPIIIIRIASLFIFRLYDFSRGLTTFDLFYFSGCANIAAHAIEILAILYIGTFHELYASPVESGDIPLNQISRYVLAINFLLSWGGAASWRILYLKRRHRWAYDRTRILIVGAGELGESVQREIKQYSRLGHEVIGLIDDDIERRSNGSPILGRMKDLPNLVKQHEIDEIIVTSRHANRQELLEIISTCQATECKVRLLPELYEVTIGQVEISQVAGVPLISLNTEPLSDWGRFLKSITDITVSSFCLLFLSPLLILISCAIKIDSTGPVLYQQRRVGKDGRIFTLLKFRTMYVDAETNSGPVLSWDKDPRVTNLGRFLRRCHLDEIPQFFNVLRGEMSLVGPRPERSHFAEKHTQEIPTYRLREAVRPGMTGLAQIHGFYNSPIEHKLRYDLAYINNMSFLLDLKILFLTLRVTFSGKGDMI